MDQINVETGESGQKRVRRRKNENNDNNSAKEKPSSSNYVSVQKELELLRRENLLLQKEKELLEREARLVRQSKTSEVGSNFSYACCSVRLTVEEIKRLIPEFNPGKNNLTSIQWIETIENVKRIQDWDDNATLFYATLRLEEAARNWFNGLGLIPDTWEKFKAKIIEDFPDFRDESAIHWQLMERSRREGESVENYCYEIAAIAAKARLSESAVIKYIISGLREKTLTNVLVSANLGSITELIQKIKSYESIRYQEKARGLLGQTVGKGEIKIDRRTRYTQNRTNTGRMLTKPSERSMHYTHGLNENKVCYICRKPNHLAKDCRDRKNNLQRFKNRSLGEPERKIRKLTTSEADSGLMKTVNVEGINIKAFLDLGSDCSTITQSEIRRQGWQCEDANVKISGFGGGSAVARGKIMKDVSVDDVTHKIELLVVNDEVQEVPMILGRNFLDQPNLCVIRKFNKLEIEKINMNQP